MMDFMQVYRALKEGKKLRRAVWDAQTWTAVINGEQVWSVYGKPPTTHNPNGYLEWVDIDATDWQIV